MGMGTAGMPGTVKCEINITPLVDVVLVLLIIFLITMPVVMRTVTLEVPRKAEDFEDVSVASKQIIITFRADQKIVLSDGMDADKDKSIQATSLAVDLRPMLEAKTGEKIVFVDFCDGVAWGDVVSTMDSVRSLAKDKGHNDIKVALKKKEKKSDLADSGKRNPCE